MREYSGILQDAYPRAEDVERLYIAAHTLAGTSASYGFPLFSEISGKLAHIFQYAMNASIAADAAASLVEFISEAVALLESDLIMISANAVEAEEDIGVFKQRYPFAFQIPAAAEETKPQIVLHDASSPSAADKAAQANPAAPAKEIAPEPLPEDGEVPAEVLEFFVPEAEEHLQVVTHCLLSLETNPVGAHQGAVDDEIGIAPDGAGEMGVGAERQAEMAGILRPVIGLGLGAQDLLHHLRPEIRLADPLDDVVEGGRPHHLAERELDAERGEIVLERHQLLARRRLVDAVHDRRLLRLQRL